MNPRIPRRAAVVGALLPLVLLAGTGCVRSDSAGDAGSKETGAEDATPHGYVEGAEEAAEHQPGLVVLDRGTGRVRLLDPLSEKVTALGRVQGAETLTGDGRFAQVGTAREAHLFDSGVWMVDHGDHTHYYRADPAAVGSVPGGRVHGTYSDPATTALTGPDGRVGLLDREKLEDGRAVRVRTLAANGSAGAAVPYERQLLVPVRQSGTDTDRIRVHARNGDKGRTLSGDCPQLEGQAVTPRGVVFGCADGALLVAPGEGKDEKLTATKIPYPQKVEKADRAREFRHRPGSATLAAPAGRTGVWTLDVGEREWSRLDAGRPVLAVNSVGQGEPTLVLTDDGTLRAHDAATGKETARTKLLSEVPDPDTARPVIEVDTSRAYVNDPLAGRVHEIDYQDELRLARSLTVPGAPTDMVETGR
ncbi:hypothetical protein MTQ01_09450 [Streptomyces sp. XM4193]|uniref:hypothetical protein n=1 Tax=Streptomyces sp. XM4193 TaxID=2929782 RepID=UPI001FFC2597|nr:hypothetical protein [Streptomyces sp. XM4193]MCK1796223.1 hypothetical protein [Streptomyces sp. XM4193]